MHWFWRSLIVDCESLGIVARKSWLPQRNSSAPPPNFRRAVMASIGLSLTRTCPLAGLSETLERIKSTGLPGECVVFFVARLLPRFSSHSRESQLYSGRRFYFARFSLRHVRCTCSGDFTSPDLASDLCQPAIEGIHRQKWRCGNALCRSRREFIISPAVQETTGERFTYPAPLLKEEWYFCFTALVSD